MTLPDPALEAAARYAVRFFLGERAAKREIMPHIKNGVEEIVGLFLAALGGRVVVEKPCEHDEIKCYELLNPDAPIGTEGELCPGGERIVIWEGEEK